MSLALPCPTIQPESFLMSTAGCCVEYVLTVSNRLLDMHELEAIKRGAKFRHFGDTSAETLIGSKTTRGDLCSYINPDTGRIEHCWGYNH
jgi:hypothetical protein